LGSTGSPHENLTTKEVKTRLRLNIHKSATTIGCPWLPTRDMEKASKKTEKKNRDTSPRSRGRNGGVSLKKEGRIASKRGEEGGCENSNFFLPGKYGGITAKAKRRGVEKPEKRAHKCLENVKRRY